MDNKIFKRIVAAAAGVTMLGTCAFATGLTTATYSDGSLSFDYTVADGATKVTYLAYAATVAGEGDTTFTTVNGTNYVLGNIVAVNQLDEIPETKSESVAISADLLGEATDIVLMSGDDLGSDVAYAVAPVVTASEAYTVTFLKADGTEYEVKTEVAKDTAISTLIPTVDPEKAKATGDKMAWGFVGWYTDAELTTKVADAVVAADTTLYPKFAQIGVHGDANADGKVNAADIAQVKSLIKLKTNYTGKAGVAIENCITTKSKAAKFGDANADGSVNAADIAQIKSLIKLKTNYTGAAGTDMVIVKD